MLRCRACFSRCLEALDTSSATAKTLPLRRNAPPATLLHTQRRLIQSVASSPVRQAKKVSTPSAEDENASKPSDFWKQSPQANRQKKWERAALRDQTSKTGSDKDLTDYSQNLGRRDPSISINDWNKRKRELQYLKDPLELANFVKKELGKGRLTEMVQLVKMASHSMQCIVSWNHIIDHYLATERVSSAWKVYNDMKKRAQFPDSYTYTILLRGLSRNAHKPNVLSKALSIYHSLFAPNSRVEPSIIHTNVALQVCARSLDMDALWGIAAKIPENGPASANVVTYVTILNAIRQNVLIGAPKGESEDEVAARKERAIIEGRRLWEDIVGRWRKADIVIDEELVCAMGRLLLVGSRPRDWDDVLSLVEQTMDIPRLVPRLGTKGREIASVPRLRAANVPQQYRYDDDHLSPVQTPMRGSEFLPVVLQGVGNMMSSSLNYATPGNNTLSMVQEACQKIVAIKAAEEYWDLLTDPGTYAVVPDVNNLNVRLRMLRQNRASSAALQLLKEGFIEKGLNPRPGTFRIAMSTCVRDKNNHNSLKTASQMLNIMLSSLEDADPKAVAMYADLAIAFPLAKGQDIVDALTHLYPAIKSIRLQLGVGAARKYGKGVGATYLKGPERQDALTAIQKAYGVYDRLLLSDMIPEEQKAPFKAERARLSAFIQRLKFKDSNRKENPTRVDLELQTDKKNEFEAMKESDTDTTKANPVEQSKTFS